MERRGIPPPFQVPSKSVVAKFMNELLDHGRLATIDEAAKQILNPN